MFNTDQQSLFASCGSWFVVCVLIVTIMMVTMMMMMMTMIITIIH